MHISNFQEAITYLTGFIKPTIFKKVSLDESHSFDPLERMKLLLSHLGNPQEKFRSVVVSGTSGKGSTAYLLSHVLTEAGYKTGFTLSPHLQKLTERIQINELQIPEDVFVELLKSVIPSIEMMRKQGVEPSYFEILLALAFRHFADKKVDIAVVEVGIEGKYDATSMLVPEVFILTNITLDHTQILGETVEAIAKEATGVITTWKDRKKSKKPIVVTGITQPSVLEIFRDVTQSADVSSVILERDFSAQSISESNNGTMFRYKSKHKKYNDLFLSLLGRYQATNAALCLAALHQLEKRGLPVLEGHIRRAFSSAFFPGRFEKVTLPGENGVEIILDGAHNPAKMEAFLSSLVTRYKDTYLIFLIAFRKNKDIQEMVHEIVKIADEVIVTKFSAKTETDVFASAEPATVLDAMNETVKKIPVQSTLTVSEGLSVIKKHNNLHKNALLVITGSLYLVGEARSLIQAKV